MEDIDKNEVSDNGISEDEDLMRIWEMLSDACVSGKWPITAVPVRR